MEFTISQRSTMVIFKKKYKLEALLKPTWDTFELQLDSKE